MKLYLSSETPDEFQRISTISNAEIPDEIRYETPEVLKSIPAHALIGWSTMAKTMVMIAKLLAIGWQSILSSKNTDDCQRWSTMAKNGFVVGNRIGNLIGNLKNLKISSLARSSILIRAGGITLYQGSLARPPFP